MAKIMGLHGKMSDTTQIDQLLARGEDSAVAISAPGRKALTYQRFRQHVEKTVAKLNDLGIGRNDTVAIVLPNGAEMASAFVSIAAGFDPKHCFKRWQAVPCGFSARRRHPGSESAAILFEYG